MINKEDKSTINNCKRQINRKKNRRKFYVQKQQRLK